MKTRLNESLETLKQAFAYQRTYLCLALPEQKWVWKTLVRRQITVACEFETQIAKLQADLSLAAGMLWSLLQQWDSARDEYQNLVERCNTKIEIDWLKANWKRSKSHGEKLIFDNGYPAVERILADKAMQHYVGCKIKQATSPLALETLESIVFYLKKLDTSKIIEVRNALDVIGIDWVDLRNLRANQYSRNRQN